MRKPQFVVAAAVLGGSLLSAAVANAQTVVMTAPPPGPVVVGAAPPPGAVVVEEHDGPRFRGGIALEGGVLAPPHVALGAIGPIGQLGVQINNLIGVYAQPGFDILFGQAGGAAFNFAIMADVTLLEDHLMVGAGLDTGAFAAFGSGALAAGGVYGIKLHGAYNIFVTRSSRGARRTALVAGVDIRLLSGPEASASANVGCAEAGTCGASASTHGFVFAPMFSIGYLAF